MKRHHSVLLLSSKASRANKDIYQIFNCIAQAEDPDEGANGQVRYQILGGREQDSPKFAIDPVSGQVQAAGNFARDAGRVFGFDVKATDRAGAEDGRSSIANVFVSVVLYIVYILAHCCISEL